MVKNKINIVNFFIAFILSAFGYEFILFIMTVHIYKLTGNPLNVGIFTALSFLPIFFSQYYGYIIDRYHKKKRVLSVAAGTVAVLIYILSNIRNLYAIYLVWFFISTFAIVILTARTSILTQFSREKSFLKANSAALIALNTAKVLGPLFGGFLATIWSAKGVLYFNCALYIGTLLFAEILILDNTVDDKQKKQTVNKQIIQGFKYVFSNTQLRYLATVLVISKLFLGFQLSLYIVYVKDILKETEVQYGMFLTAIGLGSIFGSLMGPKLTKNLNPLRAIRWGVGFHFLTLASLGMVNRFEVALPIIFTSYTVLYATVVKIHSMRDQSIASQMRGRVMGSVIAIASVPAIISMLLGSQLAKLFGADLVFLAAGIAAFMSLLVAGLLNTESRTFVSADASNP